MLERFKWWKKKEEAQEPFTAQHGKTGEDAARKHLQGLGFKFLMANYRATYGTRRGEIDLIFKDGDCLVFVEVKARATGGWKRPAGYVNKKKKLLLTKCALDYLRQINNPQIKIRFDIVEILLEGSTVSDVRHLPNTFTLTPPYRYG